jgi:ABC-2 type transport system ATP-binding protein
LGLDIEGKRSFREILKQLVEKEKISVIITSHDVNDMKKICDKIMFIHKGKKLWEYQNAEFEEMLDGYKILVSKRKIEPFTGLKLIESDDKSFRYLAGQEQLSVIEGSLEGDYRLESPTLEDILYEYYI